MDENKLLGDLKSIMAEIREKLKQHKTILNTEPTIVLHVYSKFESSLKDKEIERIKIYDLEKNILDELDKRGVDSIEVEFHLTWKPKND